MDEIYRYLSPDKDLPSEEMVLAPERWGISLGIIDVLLVIFREVLKGQGYFGLVLASELKLLAMGWFSLPNLFWQNADMNKELKGLRFVVSGSGKIAMHVLEKPIVYGAVPITVSETTKRFMLGLSTMMKQNLGVKGAMLHFLVLHGMK